MWEKAQRKSKGKRIVHIALAAVCAVAVAAGGIFLLPHWLPQKQYTAADFGIATVHSPVDFKATVWTIIPI